MMGMCPMYLERHLLLNSLSFDRYPKIQASIRDCVEQMCQKSEPMEVDEMPHCTE